MTTLAPDLVELAHANSRFEGADADAIVRWAADRFGDGLAYTCSFEDSVLIDIIARVAPSTEIILLDTQYLHAETLWFADELRRRYDLNLRIVRPLDDVVRDNLWSTDVEGCCAARKVEPLRRALEGKTAWITGVRRAESPTRSNSPIVSWEPTRSVVKINPLAAWTDDHVATYGVVRELLQHPLRDKGYPSIGCWPCTRPVSPGEDPRAGRWAGQAKTECGLHV